MLVVVAAAVMLIALLALSIVGVIAFTRRGHHRIRRLMPQFDPPIVTPDLSARIILASNELLTGKDG